MRRPLVPGSAARVLPRSAARVFLGLAALVALAGTVRSAPPDAAGERADRHGFLARMLLSRDPGERAWGAVAVRHLPAEQAALFQQVLATEVLRSTRALRAPEAGSDRPDGGAVHLDVRWLRSADVDRILPYLMENRAGSLGVVEEHPICWQGGAPGLVAPLDEFQNAMLIRTAEKAAFETRLPAQREVRVGEVVRFAEHQPARVRWGSESDDLADVSVGFACEVEVLPCAHPKFIRLRLRALSILPAAERNPAQPLTLRPTHDHVLDLSVGALDLPTFMLPDRGALLAQTCSIADGSPRRGDWLVYVCAERVVPEEEPAPR